MTIKWIPVSERLPPFDKMVLVYLPGYDNWVFPTDPFRVRVKVAWRNDEKWAMRTESYRNPNNTSGATWRWKEFGPGNYFAHEPSHWAEIDLPPGVET